MRYEIRKITESDPLIAHLSGYAPSTHIWAGLWDGELIVVWGLAPASTLSDTAYLWSWTSPKVEGCKQPFLRLSRRAVQAMLVEYPRLVGICDGPSRWLDWLGARYGGPNGRSLSFVIGD